MVVQEDIELWKTGKIDQMISPSALMQSSCVELILENLFREYVYEWGRKNRESRTTNALCIATELAFN